MAIRELPAPEGSVRTTDANEILRVFINSDNNMDLILAPAFSDPGVWGVLLVDIARHVAASYLDRGIDPQQALAAIRDALNTEWDRPAPAGMQTTRTQT